LIFRFFCGLYREIVFFRVIGTYVATPPYCSDRSSGRVKNQTECGGRIDMNATGLANDCTGYDTLSTYRCGINMSTELLANKANLAMNGYDLSPDSHRRFDDIKDWYSREFLIMCNALRHTYTTAEFQRLLQELGEYNRANGRPEIAEALCGIFAKVETSDPCRVIPLRPRGNPDCLRSRQETPQFFDRRPSSVSL
jgi:hypothetical protein